VPSRDPTQAATGWTIQVTDSAGNVYASFPTGFDDKPETTYPVTLGLVGTYYVVLKLTVTLDSSGAPTVTSDYYGLAVILTDSDMNSLPVAVNFFDTEVEPNNAPSDANPVASGVTMYGLINLNFNHVITTTDDTTGDTAQWAQGEDDDWFVYDSEGNEIATLAFCNKETCQSGDWFVEVYDQAGADQVASDPTEDHPMVAFNTDFVGGWPYSINFGLGAAGKYYLRINLKRKLEAPCVDSVPDQQCLNADNICTVQSCTSADGQSCDPSKETDGETDCVCANVAIENCGLGNSAYKDVCWQQTTKCTAYGTVVILPEQPDETPISQQYNFTWYATDMQPFTADSQAYQQVQQRPESTPTGGQ